MDVRTLPALQSRPKDAAPRRLLSPTPVSDVITPIPKRPESTSPREYVPLSITHDGLGERLAAIHLPPLVRPSSAALAGVRPAKLFERGDKAVAARRKAALPLVSAEISASRRASRAGLILQAALDNLAASRCAADSTAKSPVVKQREDKAKKKKPSTPDNTAAAAAAVRYAARHGRPRMTSNTGNIYDDVFGKLDPSSKTSRAPGPSRRNVAVPAKGNLHKVFAGYAKPGDDLSSSDEDSDCNSNPDEWPYAKMVTDSITRMKLCGVKIIPANQLHFGVDIDSGSFGVVRQGRWMVGAKAIPVAVKTSVRDDDFDEVLELFELEARMAWKAANYNTNGESHIDERHIVHAYGICYDVGEDEHAPPQLHLVMELLNCSGDVHNEIHREDHWECIRDRGRDTGKAARTQFVMTDRNDVWGYTMPRARKIEIALGLARAMRELRDSTVLHCDIKPANTVLHETLSGKTVLKLIDFGEANVHPDAQGDIAGTPGYMAPEMEVNGDASPASDMYSAGVYLIELWVGWIGPLFEEYNGVSSAQIAELRAMRAEIASALSRIERIDPTIASILRRCVSPQADRRPSPLALIRAIKKAAVVNHGDHGTTNTGIKTRRRVAAGGRRKR